MSEDKESQHELHELHRTTIENIDEAINKSLEGVDALQQTRQILESGEPYWSRVDNDTFYASDVGGTIVDFMRTYCQQSKRLVSTVGDSLAKAMDFNSTTVSGYIPTTNTAYTFIQPVDNFEVAQIAGVIDWDTRKETYADKLTAFDSELGKLYRQYLEIQYRTLANPEKAMLAIVRQMYDHLMRRLAPDDEVRAQENWKPVEPNKPKMVTRRQRIEYAAMRHIESEELRATTIANARHVVEVHDSLNKMYHTEESIDSEKALLACQAMLENIHMWIDSLNL